jgi:drug/metabolite transporter (DMT)-like permease
MEIRPGRLWDRATPLLILASTLWAGNAIASRLAVGNVSPMAMVGLRWLAISIILALVIPTAIRASAPIMWPRRWLILAMATIGLTGFNLTLYIAAHYTTAVNIVLLQCLLPGLVLLGSLVMGGRVLPTQYAGVVITCVGVALVATRGQLQDILLLRLNIGDALVLIGCVCGAAYNLMLPGRPKVPAPVFFAALSMAACAASAPLVAIEFSINEFQWPNAVGWLVILFTVFGPGLGAQVLFLRSVDLIGPGRAGVYNNLTPVFGSIFGVIVLGETFASYHAAGLTLVLAGIWMCERRRKPVIIK